MLIPIVLSNCNKQIKTWIQVNLILKIQMKRNLQANPRFALFFLTKIPLLKAKITTLPFSIAPNN
jgi:hypothetical protein